MSSFEPPIGEIRLTLLLGRTVLRGLYARRAASLRLDGDEWVLDFGSGAGLLARRIARRLNRGGRLTCVDISQRWIDVARRTLRGCRNVDFKCGEITQVDLPDRIYDLVHIHFVLHDIPAEERAPVMRRLARKLKPGGVVDIREPTRAGHGMAAAEIEQVMAQAGLRRVESCAIRSRLAGPMAQGIFQKPAG